MAWRVSRVHLLYDTHPAAHTEGLMLSLDTADDIPTPISTHTQTYERGTGWQVGKSEGARFLICMEAAQGRMDCSIHGLDTWANAGLQSSQTGSSRPGRPNSQAIRTGSPLRAFVGIVLFLPSAA